MKPAGRWLVGGLAVVLLLGAIGLAGVAAVLDRLGRTPRELAPYLETRARNHRPLITVPVGWLADALRAADGLAPRGIDTIAWAGAQPARPPLPTPDLAPRQHQLVGTIAALRDRVAHAEPGDVIELLPGTYRLQYPVLLAAAAGTATAPITLRAARLGDAVIEADATEAIKVAGPYWHFENLSIRGVCAADTDCDNAIHIVGGAHHFVLRNSRIADVNAQIKINGEAGQYPDDGRLESNTLIDTRPRDTANPVVPIDLVAASRWTVAGNLIADFIRVQGLAVSYGAYAKGGGDHNLFERNAVLCEWHLRGQPGQRIGLSFGGGGTGPEFFRNGDLAHGEQTASTMRDNLVAFCNDDAIYLNRAGSSRIANNTLIDSVGIDARFPETTAMLSANLVDGIARTRDGASLTRQDDLVSPLLPLFLGWHPERRRFVDAALLDLRWRDAPAPLPLTPADAPATDLCGAPVGARARPGAFDDFLPCLRQQPRP